MIELESILDIISFADKESLRRMMRHAKAYMTPHNYDHRIRDSKETAANEAFKHDDTFQQHRNQIMNSIYNYTEHLLNQCKH